MTAADRSSGFHGEGAAPAVRIGRLVWPYVGWTPLVADKGPACCKEGLLFSQDGSLFVRISLY